MKIAVLGGGHQGYAIAADLARDGHAVRLWRRSAARFGDVARTGRLLLRERGEETQVTLDLASGDLAAVLDGAERVIMSLPATGHVEVARAAAEHLPPAAHVLLTPGHLNSIEVARVLREGGHEASVAETPHPPFGSRKQDDEQAVAISVWTVRLPLGVLPATATDTSLAAWQALYSQLIPAEDALDAALGNPNPCLHPPLMLTNAGAIESFEHHDIHTVGTTRSTLRLIRSADADRVALRKALGYPSPHWEIDTLFDPDLQGTGFFPADTMENVYDSGDWDEPLDLTSHRYLTEDVGCSLVLWERLATELEVAVPTLSDIITLVCVLMDRDLRARPSTDPLAHVDDGLDGLREVMRRGW